MKASIIASALSIVVLTVSTASVADERDDHRDEHRDDQHYVHHDEWRRGARIRNEDWSRGQTIDYRERHLRAPPRGYEWREVDGNYVLAAVATGVIASVIAAAAAGR